MKIETKLTGDLAGDLSRFEKAVQEKVLFSGVAAMASVMYEEARANVPVKSGLLKSHIYRAYSPEKSTDQSKTYRISWNKRLAPHGHLIEFGTSRAPAYPFIRPAFDHVGEAIKAGQARMEQRLDEGIT
jgi:HK97 gp10 family phage protein